jgi:CheY-like chemotaxis protein
LGYDFDEKSGSMRSLQPNILVIDDEQDTLKLLKIALEKRGFSALTASNWDDVAFLVERAAVIERPIDLIILDIMMPDRSGFDVLRALQVVLAPLPPVIMLSAVTGIDQQIKAMELGAAKYMTKPTTPTKLISAIDEILKRKNWVMPSALYDLGYIQVSIESLSDFLVSKNLFWPLNVPPPFGEPPFARLTLGGLLLSFARLRSRRLLPSQFAKLHSLESKYNHLISRMRNAWLKKAQREFLSRLRQWDLYLLDLSQTPDDHIAYYGSEVRIRVILELLAPKIDPPAESYLEKLDELDNFLRKILDREEFIWEPDLAEGFDSNVFWYLWGSPNIMDLELYRL